MRAWGDGFRQVRSKRVESQIPLNPVTAGIYIATMMAQVPPNPLHPGEVFCADFADLARRLGARRADLAMRVRQIDVLRENGHSYTEIVNESVRPPPMERASYFLAVRPLPC